MQLPDDLDKVRDAPATAGRVMTKYEFDQIVGLRTTHLSKGAPFYVDVPDGFHIESNLELRDVALRELRERKLPYIVKRTLPSGGVEYCRVALMDLAAVEHLMTRPARRSPAPTASPRG